MRTALGPAAEKVEFADITDVGGNPGRVIGVWRRFAEGHADASQLRGVGEAVFPGRSPAELAECQLYEELLNVAFDPATPMQVLCPYDVTDLPGPVIEDARRTHPFLIGGVSGDPGLRRVPAHRPGRAVRPAAASQPGDAPGIKFQRGGLGSLRAFVTAQAQQAGLDQRPASALVAAINELATNSLQHGGGQGELRIWTDDGWLLCEVSDQGHLTQPLAGRLPRPRTLGRPVAGQPAHRPAADSLHVGGTVVRVHQKLSA